MATKSELVLYLILFYTILSIFVGFISNETNKPINEEIGNIKENIFTFSDIIKGYSELPFYVNSIIFGSFFLLFTWIVLSSLPTFNGGG